jgi:hypothetical protein
LTLSDLRISLPFTPDSYEFRSNHLASLKKSSPSGYL